MTHIPKKHSAMDPLESSKHKNLSLKWIVTKPFLKPYTVASKHKKLFCTKDLPCVQNQYPVPVREVLWNSWSAAVKEIKTRNVSDADPHQPECYPVRAKADFHKVEIKNIALLTQLPPPHGIDIICLSITATIRRYRVYDWLFKSMVKKN